VSVNGPIGPIPCTIATMGETVVRMGPHGIEVWGVVKLISPLALDDLYYTIFSEAKRSMKSKPS